MQHKDKIINYYQSNRYECDYTFYQQFQHLLKDLNLYSLLPLLNQNFVIVKKIKEIAEANARSLDDDYDDEEGISQTLKIKQLWAKINSNDINYLMRECQSMNWESYEFKIQRYLKDNKLYIGIVDRIKTSIHNEQLRLDSMLFVCLFQFIHRENLNQVIQQYLSTIEHYLEILQKAKRNIDTISEASAYSNMLSITKVRQYIYGLNLILKTILRYCEIVKILTGKSNLSLKFNIIKKEMEKILKISDWKLNITNSNLFKCNVTFAKYLKNGTKPTNNLNICKYCFENTESNFSHKLCDDLINCKI